MDGDKELSSGQVYGKDTKPAVGTQGWSRSETTPPTPSKNLFTRILSGLGVKKGAAVAAGVVVGAVGAEGIKNVELTPAQQQALVELQEARPEQIIYLEVVNEENPEGEVNVRDNPSSKESRVVDKLKPGEKISGLPKEGNDPKDPENPKKTDTWYAITLPPGHPYANKPGFVNRQYVKIDNVASSNSQPSK